MVIGVIEDRREMGQLKPHQYKPGTGKWGTHRGRGRGRPHHNGRTTRALAMHSR